MKQYIFHVPEQSVVVCAVEAMDEAMAWRLLNSGQCQRTYTRPGNTASGKPELVRVQDVTTGPKKPNNGGKRE